MTKPNEVKVGDVVRLEAVDWAMFDDTYHRDTEFEMAKGVIYGLVVRTTEESVAVAPQVFSDGGVRKVIALPWVTVGNIRVFGQEVDLE